MDTSGLPEAKTKPSSFFLKLVDVYYTISPTTTLHTPTSSPPQKAVQKSSTKHGFNTDNIP